MASDWGKCTPQRAQRTVSCVTVCRPRPVGCSPCSKGFRADANNARSPNAARPTRTIISRDRIIPASFGAWWVSCKHGEPCIRRFRGRILVIFGADCALRRLFDLGLRLMENAHSIYREVGQNESSRVPVKAAVFPVQHPGSPRRGCANGRRSGGSRGEAGWQRLGGQGAGTCRWPRQGGRREAGQER